MRMSFSKTFCQTRKLSGKFLPGFHSLFHLCPTGSLLSLLFCFNAVFLFLVTSVPGWSQMLQTNIGKRNTTTRFDKLFQKLIVRSDPPVVLKHEYCGEFQVHKTLHLEYCVIYVKQILIFSINSITGQHSIAIPRSYR